MNNNENTNQTNTTNVPNAGGTVSNNVVNSTTNTTGVQPTSTNQIASSQDVNPTVSNTVSVPNAVPVTNSTDSSGNPVENNGTVVPDEKLKSVEIDYKPPSKFKLVMTALLFIFLFFFIVFLPDITSMVSKYKASKNAPQDEVITTGKLECELNSSTTNLDMNYFRIFKFTDSKLYAAEYNVTTKGDATLDEKALDEMNAKCEHLSKNTESLQGITVSCKYSEGKLEETQSYEFGDIDFELLDSAFTEAGGTYPEFKNGQAIEDIEKVMNAAGYSCMRKK